MARDMDSTGALAVGMCPLLPGLLHATLSITPLLVTAATTIHTSMTVTTKLAKRVNASLEHP